VSVTTKEDGRHVNKFFTTGDTLEAAKKWAREACRSGVEIEDEGGTFFYPPIMIRRIFAIRRDQEVVPPVEPAPEEPTVEPIPAPES
jgi:hypothetical protein